MLVRRMASLYGCHAVETRTAPPRPRRLPFFSAAPSSARWVKRQGCDEWSMPRLTIHEIKEALLQRELANTRQIVPNLTVMGMRPDLSAKEREIVPERSARAELKLRIKVLRYCRERQRGRQR
jgi:hypothetical protein